MWNPLKQWRERRIWLTEDELLDLLQKELEKRGIYGSSNAHSTSQRDVKVVYVWPGEKLH